MVDFTPSFSVRFRDDSDVGQAVDGLQAEVYNQLSELVYLLTLGSFSPVASPEDSPYPQIVEQTDDEGVYYEIVGAEITDSDVFPGSLVQVKWTVQDTTLSVPATWKAYPFYPVQSRPGAQSVVLWEPITHEATHGYEVASKRPGEEEYTVVGYSTWPVFLDTTNYGNEQTASAVTYRVQGLTYNLESPASVTFTAIQASEVTSYRTEEDLCVVSGRLTDVAGRSFGVARPLFYVHDQDTPLFINQTLLHQQREFTATVDSNGNFAAPLVQGSLVTLEIAAAGYALKFVVPPKPHADISSLTGTQQNLRRGE